MWKQVLSVSASLIDCCRSSEARRDLERFGVLVQSRLAGCSRSPSRPSWRASLVGALDILVRPRLIGRTPHDFRRTAARNLIRAGVAQHIVLRLCGWKTDAMFRRYAIVDEQDLRDAVAKLAGVETPQRDKTKKSMKSRRISVSGF